MAKDNQFILSVPTCAHVVICGLEYKMLPNSAISFDLEDLRRFADMDKRGPIVITIDPVPFFSHILTK